MRSRPKFALLVGRYWTVPRAHDRPEVTITLYSNPHVSLCSFNEGCERSRDTDVVACQVSRRQNNLRQGSRPVSVAQVGVELLIDVLLTRACGLWQQREMLNQNHARICICI